MIGRLYYLWPYLAKALHHLAALYHGNQSRGINV